MNKEHLMTPEEKEKFLNRVKIETEGISASKNPKDEFTTKIDLYQDNMKKQINELEKLIKVQEHLMLYAEKLFNTVANDLPKDTLKTEISTKQEVIMQARTSMALMRERIKLGEMIKQSLVDNYDFLSDIDFYFNGVLNMPELEARRDAIINADKTNVN